MGRSGGRCERDRRGPDRAAARRRFAEKIFTGMSNITISDCSETGLKGGKTMKKRMLLEGTAILFLVLAVFVSQGRALEVGARGYYWFPHFYGSLRADADGVEGTKIDLGAELGIEDRNLPFFEVFAGLGKHHLSFMYTRLNYADSVNLTDSITFLGTTYHAGDLLDTDVNIQMLDFEYQYDLINLENLLAGFSIGVIGKVKYIAGEARLSDLTRGYHESKSFGIPVPMVGAGVHVGLLLNILEARAKIAGIGFSGNWFYEGLADVSWTPFPFLDIHGGYRIIKLDIEDVNDVYADFEFSGPYAGLTISF
jgi:hypothetical protein